MSEKQTISPAKSLLVVDDDRLVLRTLAGGLIQASYRVTTAESAEEAEAHLIGGETVDLVILDVRMPGIGGLHLARRLRDLDRIPFMMLSAYGDANTVAQAARYGAMGFAVKPIAMEQLLPAITAALARADDLQELRDTRQQLQQALDGDRSVNVATGILMMEHQLTRAMAFARLRDIARSQRRKLSELAQDMIHAHEAAKSIASAGPQEGP